MATPALFADQHAIVTGGSSGIGKAIAQLLASQGATVSIIARRQAQLDQAKAEIEAQRLNPSQQVLTLSADVSVQEQAEQAIEKAIAQLGAPHILVTSAGTAHPGQFSELAIDVFERTMAINYFGTLYCIRAALPAMTQQQQGRIVMISSGAGLIGLYGYTPYSPTKFAVRGLAESLRGELKPLGIEVSIAYPPDTDTPQLAEENKTKPEATQRITATAETWSSEAVARAIITGLQKNQFAITPGTEMTVLNRLHSVISPLLNQYFDGIVTKVLSGK